MSTRSGAAAVRARRGHKERSKNFTELEKRTVLELIARHRDVLRQGRSNNATNRSKQLVWSRICEEVNRRCGGERPRTPAQVKMWYENYKKKCKMRAQDDQHPTQETSGLLDGMLWQSIHPLEGTEDDGEAATSAEGFSVKDEDCVPVNMCSSAPPSPLSAPPSPRVSPRALEPHVSLHVPTAPPPQPHMHLSLQNLSYLQKLNELSNTPLNLSHLDNDERRNGEERRERESERHDCQSATEEERMYYSVRRQHATWEHEAKMRILNMELKQKEEIFSLQKQLFLIELKLKMDFLEKASGK